MITYIYLISSQTCILGIGRKGKQESICGHRCQPVLLKRSREYICSQTGDPEKTFYSKHQAENVEIDETPSHDELIKIEDDNMISKKNSATRKEGHMRWIEAICTDHFGKKF